MPHNSMNVKNGRTLATAGTPTTEGTSTTVVTGAERMVTTTGLQQQQKSQ
jgi:hypothetical protein